MHCTSCATARGSEGEEYGGQGVRDACTSKVFGFYLSTQCCLCLCPCRCLCFCFCCCFAWVFYASLWLTPGRSTRRRHHHQSKHLQQPNHNHGTPCHLPHPASLIYAIYVRTYMRRLELLTYHAQFGWRRCLPGAAGHTGRDAHIVAGIVAFHGLDMQIAIDLLHAFVIHNSLTCNENGKL